MTKSNTIVIIILILGGMAVFALPSQIFQTLAQEAKFAEENKKLPQLTDRNKNKIFDNLEELLTGQPTDAVFDTIVLFEENLSDALFETAKARIGDFVLKYQYPSISGIATTLTKGQIIALSRLSFVKQVEHDATMTIFLDKANYWFGTEKARDEFGLDGNADGLTTYSENDIVIAIIDTGIDPDHIDLDGDKIIGWKDIVNGQSNPYDDNGHGTHVSSIAAGEGEGNALYKGVAPGAALVGVKVLDRQGNGSTSGVNAGIQWVINNKATYGINVANMSLGIAGCSDGSDSTSLLVNNVVAAGIVMTVSAGNEGPGECTVGSPAAAESAITVGAMADIEPGTASAALPAYGFYQAYFSSRGPTADGRIKPDISAPGVKITAAEAGSGNGYVEFNGTSMSSPFIAGLVALMLHANHLLTTTEIKTMIEATAIDWGVAGKDIDYGSGRLDGYEAIKRAGGLSGINITIPTHAYEAGSLASTGDEVWIDINVSDIFYPIAVTLIMPDWQILGPPGPRRTDPDFDIKLYAPDGTTLLASSETTRRQETIGYQPTATGIYKLRVFSFSGSGDYFFDVSFGESSAVAITLNSDGITAFGIVASGEIIETTSFLVEPDIQIIEVTTGPANISVRSTNFTDGLNVWTLGVINGADQVKWEFSEDGTTWKTFDTPDTLFTLDTNVSEGHSRNLYLKLTTPTSSSSANEHSATVTFVATTP